MKKLIITGFWRGLKTRHSIKIDENAKADFFFKFITIKQQQSKHIHRITAAIKY